MIVSSTKSSMGNNYGNWLFKNKEHGKASVVANLVNF